MPLFQNESTCQTISYENDFDLHENEPVGGTNFHKNGFALGLVLKQRHKGIRGVAELIQDKCCLNVNASQSKRTRKRDKNRYGRENIFFQISVLGRSQLNLHFLLRA